MTIWKEKFQVIKMIVQYYRSKGSLRELLEPLVRGVLDDKSVHINLIPVFWSIQFRKNFIVNTNLHVSGWDLQALGEFSGVWIWKAEWQALRRFYSRST